MIDKKSARLRRATKARAKMEELGATRLVVFRTPRHIYAQIIAGGQVLAAASTLEKDLKAQCKYTGNVDAAKVVGKAIAERALAKDVKRVAFDRSGFLYHGRIKALAEAAREQDYSSKGGKRLWLEITMQMHRTASSRKSWCTSTV